MMIVIYRIILVSCISKITSASVIVAHLSTAVAVRIGQKFCNNITQENNDLPYRIRPGTYWRSRLQECSDYGKANYNGVLEDRDYTFPNLEECFHALSIYLPFCRSWNVRYRMWVSRVNIDEYSILRNIIVNSKYKT